MQLQILENLNSALGLHLPENFHGKRAENEQCIVTRVFCLCPQASFYSTALKTLVTVSTLILLGLIVAYHALEVQVSAGNDHRAPTVHV